MPEASSHSAFLTVYDELRALARRRLSAANPGQTLQATALVHEVWLKLADARASGMWRDAEHFYATAAQALRWILVDRARRRTAAKRAHARADVEPDALAEDSANAPGDDANQRAARVVELEDALAELERLRPRQARVVELRHYAGLSIEQTAEVMGISPATVKREWQIARARLLARLDGDAERET